MWFSQFKNVHYRNYMSVMTGGVLCVTSYTCEAPVATVQRRSYEIKK